MKHCLNKEQIDFFLKYFFNNNNEDNDVVLIVENSKQWIDQIFILNYLVTQIIQKKIKKGNLPNNFIEKLYSLKDVGDIVIDEIDVNFIEFIFNHLSVSNEMIDNLIYYKTKQINYDYSGQIRY
ncbi:MAG: hypothetical protein A2033_16165 [Bacteroidetes bacterium GWA2_31_9]|nr:MAG: hypothetical protein A2033_16165 [Bacteroidetes bacterium GWA2_31_9]